MTWITTVVFVAAALVGQDGPERNPSSREVPEQAQQRRFEDGLFVRAGFPPLAEPRSTEIRRLLLRDPYGMLPIPGLETRRAADGSVSLSVQYWAWRSDLVAIPPASWGDLEAKEAAMFAPTPEDRTVQARADPTQPPPICHGWTAFIQTDDGRTASWAQCGGAPGPAYVYATTMVELAVSTRPACKFDATNPFWSFSTCFTPGPELSDPALEAAMAPLRSEWNAAPGSARLAEARQALNVGDLTLGSPSWLAAREAVEKVRALHDLQRARLQTLRQLHFGAPTASEADKAKMEQTIESWNDFLLSQEANYSNLLTQLVWTED